MALLSPAYTTAEIIGLQAQHTHTELSPKAIAHLSQIMPSVPACDDLDVILNLSFQGSGVSPASIALKIALGASVQVDDTLQNILAAVSGQMRTASKEWAISSSNYDSVFAKAIVRQGDVRFFLPVALSNGSRRVSTTLLAKCSLLNARLTCSELKALGGQLDDTRLLLTEAGFLPR